MKILIFTTHFYPYIGGLENYILNSSLELIKQGHKVDVLTFKYDNLKKHEIYKGINIYRIPGWNILGNTYKIPKPGYKKIINKIKKNKYDIVNTQTRFFITSYLGMKFAKKNKIKYIHTEHGNTFVKHSNKLIQLFAYLYDITIGKLIFRTADLVIGISTPSAKFAKKMGAKKTIIIHNSINTSVFKKNKTNLRNKLKISKDKTILTYVGRLIYAKGIQNLIKASKSLNVELIIVGEGPYKNKLKQLSKELKIKTHFLGQKTQKEIIKILSITTIFINPSYSEGLPTSVLEAGAIGLPIIATNVGGTNEIINKKTGILIPPKQIKILKNKIIYLINNKKEQKKLSKNIKIEVKNKFEIRKNTKKLIEIFK